MSLHIQDIRVLSEKYHCNVNCSECTYSAKCKHIDTQNIRYRPQAVYISEKIGNKEIPLDTSDYLVLPKLKETKKDSIRKKLLDLLLAVIFHEQSETCNVETLANYLNISILQVQKRLDYLDENQLMQVSSFGDNLHIHFVDKTADKNEKFKSISSTYIQEFKNKVQNQTPLIEKIDYVTIRKFCKTTIFTPEQLVLLVKEYFNTNQLFLRNTGYRLRNFPSYINAILLNKPNLFNDVSIQGPSKQQLEQYEKGKAEGKWNGQEPWAKNYEEALQKIKDSFKPMRINGH